MKLKKQFDLTFEMKVFLYKNSNFLRRQSWRKLMKDQESIEHQGKRCL